MAYGCAGSSPAFRTISKGNNDANGVLIVADKNGGESDSFLSREVRAPFNRQPSQEAMEFITNWFENAVAKMK